MKYSAHVISVFLVICSIVGTYFLLKAENFNRNTLPSSSVNLNECIQVNTDDIENRIKVVDMMRKYLTEKKNIPLTTSFVGSVVEGTNCFTLKIDKYELYETADKSLVVLELDKEIERIPVRLWAGG